MVVKRGGNVKESEKVIRIMVMTRDYVRIVNMIVSKGRRNETKRKQNALLHDKTCLLSIP